MTFVIGFVAMCIVYYQGYQFGKDAGMKSIGKAKLKYVSAKTYKVLQENSAQLFILDKENLDKIILKNVHQYGASYTAEAIVQHLCTQYVDVND